MKDDEYKQAVNSVFAQMWFINQGSQKEKFHDMKKFLRYYNGLMALGILGLGFLIIGIFINLWFTLVWLSPLVLVIFVVAFSIYRFRVGIGQDFERDCEVLIETFGEGRIQTNQVSLFSFSVSNEVAAFAEKEIRNLAVRYRDAEFPTLYGFYNPYHVFLRGGVSLPEGSSLV